MLQVTEPGSEVHTDECHAYDDLGHTRFLGNHKRQEWARDDDADGVREVHSNRIEGYWLGLRNDLRPFRGWGKWCLGAYLAFYEDISTSGTTFLASSDSSFGPSPRREYEPDHMSPSLQTEVAPCT